MLDVADMVIQTNEFQTPITQEFLDSMEKEVQDQFMDLVDNIPFIKYMISPDRPRAKDLPKDSQGRIIIDLAHPHILEDMDYFRPAAKFYEENGCYTFLKPNKRKGSEYDKWFREERRRCRQGYVRESDGEWITGYMYFYLNYCPIKIVKTDKKTGIQAQVESFPLFWEGVYWRFHYIEQARVSHKHCIELARRGASKSYVLASIMAHNLIFGENSFAKKRVTTVLTAYTKEYLAEKDGTLSKFVPIIDFCAAHTEFPRLLIKNSPSELLWISGYKDKNGNNHGSQNQVMGLSVKDDESKIRGKRGLILFEEMGSYKNLLSTYDNVRDSVKDGEYVFAEIILVGTAGDSDSDFSGAKTILYNPEGYDIYPIKNVWDFPGKGTDKFGFFFPSYISRSGCMDENGNSDVVKALKSILETRYKVKKSGDPASLLSVTAQMPITPAEAILKVRSNFFPVPLLNERMRQLDSDPRAYDDVYIGTFVNNHGKIEFRATEDQPIRKWPVPNTTLGAVEIYEMPVTDSTGQPTAGRYILGVDPIDNDSADSESLFSAIMFDLFTDRIVAEYTGRQPYADDNYRIAYYMCRFFNAVCMYESNKRGMYSYFAKMGALELLAECPAWLTDKGLVKYSMFGSSAKGVNVSAPLNSVAIEKIRDWMLKTVTRQFKDENDNPVVDTVPQLFLIRSYALLQEAVGYSPEVNTDRISALSQVMFYREQFLIDYGDIGEEGFKEEKSVADDPFFDIDWKKYQSMHKN